jgi:hypothetical protein
MVGVGEVTQPDVDAFVSDLVAKQREIDANRRAMAKEIVDGQRLESLDDAKRFAQAWIESAAQFSDNAAYATGRYEKAEAELVRVQRDHGLRAAAETGPPPTSGERRGASMMTGSDWRVSATISAALDGYRLQGEDNVSAVARLLRELDQLNEQVGHVQGRCTELLDEARARRWFEKASPGLRHILGHVVHERSRQDDRWGDCSAPGRVRVKDGTGGQEMEVLRDSFRTVVDDAAKQGSDTWAMILAEEVAEVMAETDPKRIRAELVQVAAVSVLWIEMIDRRAASETLAPPPMLPGWTCDAPGCLVFNGEAKETLTACRCCGLPRPPAEWICDTCHAPTSQASETCRTCGAPNVRHP